MIRAQQRGIPPAALQVLIDFGSERRRGGASELFMDKEARALARRALGECLYRRIAGKSMPMSSSPTMAAS